MTSSFGGITNTIEIHDHEIDALQKGPVAWAKKHYGQHMSIDAFARALQDQVDKIGLKSEIKVYDTNQRDVYVFEVEINGRHAGNLFDPDRQVHEVVNNFLEIPGEGGTIDTKSAIAEWNKQQKQKRKH